MPRSKKHPFKEKSDFDPGPSGNKELERYLGARAVEEELDVLIKNPQKIEGNVTREERKAIKLLKSKQNVLVIKKADKGSTITVANIERYILDGEAHLADKKAYKKLDGDRTAEIANRMKQFVTQIHQVGYIDNIELHFLMPPDPVSTQYIYFLYKIHKSPVAVRPVVSGVNGAATRISKYLDHFFKQLVPKVKSYLRNSQQLVEMLRTMVLPDSEEDILLVSMDESRCTLPYHKMRELTHY